MKIVKLEAIPASVPYTHVERSSRVTRGGVSDVIVKLTTDSGLVGWGESCCGADTASIVAAVQAMAAFVVGRDPWSSEAIARDVYKEGLWDFRVGTANFAFAGIDMALLDLCGKDCGQPIHRLFGGAVRDHVEYFYYLSVGTPDEVSAQCRDGAAAGYRCFYIKVGVDAVAEEKMLEAIRAAIGPQRKIRIDANEAWSPPEALRLLTRWNERFGIDFAEAPVKAFPHSLMRSLKDRVPVAICANEGLGSEADVLRTIEAGAADVLCFSSYWVGSLRRFHTLSHLAHLAGLTVCKHTHGELGIAAAAAHHILLTLPNAIDGAQQTAAMMEDDILTKQLPIASGPLWGIPDGAGLGIEVDEDKLRHFHKAYRQHGQFLPYGVSKVRLKRSAWPLGDRVKEAIVAMPPAGAIEGRVD